MSLERLTEAVATQNTILKNLNEAVRILTELVGSLQQRIHNLEEKR
jgi:hypothetical protein